MTRLGWTGSLSMTLGLALGLAIGWGLARQVAGLPGQLIRVGRVPTYEPVEIVPDSAGWPAGPAVQVKTVEPPNRKEARKLEQDFGFRLDRTSVLGKFDLPAMPDGGKAVVTVVKRDNTDKPGSGTQEGGNEDAPLPVDLTAKANKPPLLRVRWEPRLEGWYGYSTEGNTWSGYVGLPRLLCIRGRVCLQARGGYEVRPWGDGAVAGIGLSVRF